MSNDDTITPDEFKAILQKIDNDLVQRMDRAWQAERDAAQDHELEQLRAENAALKQQIDSLRPHIVARPDASLESIIPEAIIFLRLMGRYQDELHDLARLVPECPQHGEACLSHLREWIMQHATPEQA